MLRVILLLGLVVHKLVWEVLKRSGPAVSTSARPPSTRLSPVKAVKMAALGGLLLQTVRLDVLPISRRSRTVRGLGLALYVAGLTTAIVGRLQLGSNWVDLEDARVLPGQAVVSHGIYRFIRHPIYAGDLLLVTGLQLALNSWLVLGAAALFVVVARRAAAEEDLLSAQLSDYQAYRQATKRFIPFLF
jgi:protein-S-isoprenylcysteine O-methyltransferase Ste14